VNDALRVLGSPEGLPVVTAVLTALVGVHDDRVLRLASQYRHQQRIEHEFAIDP